MNLFGGMLVIFVEIWHLEIQSATLCCLEGIAKTTRLPQPALDG